jgi:Fe2+ transport system protein FeoA
MPQLSFQGDRRRYVLDVTTTSNYNRKPWKIGLLHGSTIRFIKHRVGSEEWVLDRRPTACRVGMANSQGYLDTERHVLGLPVSSNYNERLWKIGLCDGCTAFSNFTEAW